MIAFAVSAYLVISIGFFIMITLMMMIGAMFGSLSLGDYFKAAGVSVIWPVMLVWGFGNWTIHKIRN